VTQSLCSFLVLRPSTTSVFALWEVAGKRTCHLPLLFAILDTHVSGHGDDCVAGWRLKAFGRVELGQ
jgi:hypothetical protein